MATRILKTQRKSIFSENLMTEKSENTPFAKQGSSNLIREGGILNVGYEKILLLYNPATYEVADVISTYTYRMGLQGAQWSFSTAVGLFNSAVNIVFLLVANKFSKKVSGSGLF